ncbi:MAG: zinc ABC transporter substrate-binding protein [Myxococcota bacterium]|jgi:zinc transport system substrate-binding protein
MATTLLALTLAAAPLKVGVTLHPYYSWTANVAAGLPVEVRPVLPGEVDVGAYQPRPEDVAKLGELDALVINGIGHDDFILDMLKASGNTRCKVIRANETTALLRGSHGEAVNSHTFLSFSNAIQQSYVIARALGELRPELSAALTKNASAYAKKLRALRAAAVKRVSAFKGARVITVHDGYSYLLQELGVGLAGVVEPAHGLVPSAAELGQVVEQVKKEGVHLVLSEERFPAAMTEVLRDAGAKVVVVSHVATGAYTPERFEVEMQANVDALVAGLSP